MTTTPDSALLPCPFCGNKKPFIRYEWQICCGKLGTSRTTCATEGPFARSEAAAIKAWNTRTPAASQAQTIAALREVIRTEALVMRAGADKLNAALSQEKK